MADVQDSDDNTGTSQPQWRPQFPRSNTDPSWSESQPLAQANHHAASDDITHAKPILKKQHSALSITVPDPPRRPARNPARSDPPHPKPKPIVVTRPSNDSDTNSTNTGTKEDVTPWELFPAPESGISEIPSAILNINTDVNPTSTAASSSMSTPASLSPVSSRPRASQPSTGPVADVTPWELYPAPPHSPTVDSPAGSISNSKNAGSSVNTGRVEDVTPWELYTVPDVHPQRANLSTLATGPVEDVTPWDLVPSPPQSAQTPMSAPPTGAGDKSRSTLRVSTSSNTSANSKSLADLAHVAHLRRRKSTGAKVYAAHHAAKARSNTVNATSFPLPSDSANHSPVLEYQSSPVSISNGTGIGTHHRSATSSATSVPGPRRGLRTSTSAKSLPTTPKLAKAPLASHPHAPPTHADHPTNGIPSPMSSNTHLNSNHSEADVDQRFSTADRTIYKELKRNLEARENCFSYKGMDSKTDCPLAIPRGKKHHALSREEAPYPRNYEREVLDLDIWEVYHNRSICDSWTWHVFDTPPMKVLDLGCGTGTWILNAAKQWKGTEFVGLDLVPIQPDLTRVGSSELASRVTWSHHNFLDGLPFADEEFDYVHIKRIALGVPENKWDFLFEEISRVLKPNGAFEMFEEDLFFPGKPIDVGDDDNESVRSSSDAGHSRHSMDTIGTANNHNAGHETIIHHGGVDPRSSLDGSTTTTLTLGSGDYRHSIDTISSTIVFDPEESFPPRNSQETADRSHYALVDPASAPSTELNNTEGGKDETDAAELLRYVMVDYERKQLERQASFPSKSVDILGKSHAEDVPTSNHGDPVTTPTQPYFPSSVPAQSQSNRASPLVPNKTPKFAGSTMSLLMSSVGGGIPPPEDILPPLPTNNARGTRQRGYSMGATQKPAEFSRARNGSHPSITNTASEPLPPLPSSASTTFNPPLHPMNIAGFKGKDKPKDPHDHSLIAFIWEEMLASRFINTFPLALLHNSLILYFKDVQSHPPLQIAFPPSSTKLKSRLAGQDRDHKSLGSRRDSQTSRPPDSAYDSDGARDAVLPSPLTRTASYSNLSNHSSSMQIQHTDIEPIAEVESLGEDDDISEDQRYVSVAGLLKRQSKWMSLDDSRYSAYGPKKKQSFSALPPLNTDVPPENEFKETSPGVLRKLQRGSGLPNSTMHLDQRQVNLHLALRTAEILACAETMWEWVSGYQVKLQKQREARQAQQAQRSTSMDSHGAQPRKSTSSSITTVSARSTDPNEQLRESLEALTRPEFNEHLASFEADMRDHYSLGGVMEERFGWYTMQIPPTDQQKAFEKACRNWEDYKASALQHQILQSNRTSTSSFHAESGSRSRTTSQNGLPTTRRRERALTVSSVDSVSVPASKRLSRSVRVFTAFKSEGPLFTDLAGHKKGTLSDDPSDQESILQPSSPISGVS